MANPPAIFQKHLGLLQAPFDRQSGGPYAALSQWYDDHRDVLAADAKKLHAALGQALMDIQRAIGSYAAALEAHGAAEPAEPIVAVEPDADSDGSHSGGGE